MLLFPIHRPRIGLSFSEQTVCLVELGRRWFGRQGARPVRVCERPLPEGLIRPSDTDLNITDVPALAGLIRDLVGISGTLPVAMSLPDRCGQIGLFDFESFPQQYEEGHSLLRWRFRDELNMLYEDIHLAFRAFRDGDPGTATGKPMSPGTRVLAVGIRRRILDQYERVCLEAGLMPVAVGFSSLQLFDLCRIVMSPAEELFFTHHTADGFAFVAVRHGYPVYIRVKSLRRDLHNLTDEILGTLQFYDDQAPHTDLAPDSPCQRLFLIDGDLRQQDTSEVLQHPAVEQSLLCPTGNQDWRVEVVPLGWTNLRFLGGNGAGYPASGLSALAGLVAG